MARAMSQYLLAAAGKDRPGIVAAVTKILYKHGCNLADSAMTRLASEFAMLLIFQAPARFNPAGMRGDLEEVEKRLGLLLSLKPLRAAETRPVKPRGRPYVLSVYGADRPGIVYRVSRLLASKGVNITDVSTHRTAEKKKAGYVLLLEVELPPRRRPADLDRSLQRLVKPLGLHVSLRPIEVSRL
ncbi:MAG: ACT domain-containing protein [Elusimicrobiota bacterium]